MDGNYITIEDVMGGEKTWYVWILVFNNPVFRIRVVILPRWIG